MSNTADPHSSERNGADRSASRSPLEGAPANALPLTASEDRQFATLAHFGGILGFAPALLIHLIFKDRGPFTAQESKEALNFTLPPTLFALLAWILSLVPVIGTAFAILNAVIWLALTVFAVTAGVQVNRGRPFRYPLNLRLIR